jgi:hypothetical protein
MKEVACMAANGDEASILMWMIRGGSTVPKPVVFQSIAVIERIPLQAIGVEGINQLLI